MVIRVAINGSEKSKIFGPMMSRSICKSIKGGSMW